MSTHVEEGKGMAGQRRMSRVRLLLGKAAAGGLSGGERILLKGELARIAALVARVNTLAGGEAVRLGPYAGLLVEREASAAVAL